MLMYQRGDHRWLRLLSQSTVVLVVHLVSIITRPSVDRPTPGTCQIPRTCCRLGKDVLESPRPVHIRSRFVFGNGVGLSKWMIWWAAGGVG